MSEASARAQSFGGAIIGALLGVAIGELPGFLFGGALGYLLGLTFAQAASMRVLAARVASLEAAQRESIVAPPVQRSAERAAPLAERIEALESAAVASAADDAAPATPSVAARPPPAIPSAPPVAPSAALQHAAPVSTPVRNTEPSTIERAIATAWQFLTTGNVVAKVGVLLLFVGVAFLVNYAVENSLLPPALRLAGASLLGVALLGVGFRLRRRADAYGLLLQGAGIGVLYLAVFAAFQLYQLLPATPAFALLVLIVAASSSLAVMQKSEAMAAFGLAGGFLAPVLTSTGQGDYVGLFSYYLLLNLGILGMAWFRSWRWVNLLGFVFTFGIGTLWGRDGYTTAKFVGVEAFLIYFFLHYVLVSVLFARGIEVLRQQADASAKVFSAAVNGTLVFGLPVAVLGLQAVLLQGRPLALAFSALGMAAVYVLALYATRRMRVLPALLSESYLALALVFATLAIPFAVSDARLTAAAWALEGAGLIWLGLRQHRLFNRLLGLLLQCAAAYALADSIFEGGPLVEAVGPHPGPSLACAIVALSAWLISWFYASALHGRVAEPGDAAAAARHLQLRMPGLVSGLLMLWAWPWWTFAALRFLDEEVEARLLLPAFVIAAAFSTASIARLGAQFDWPSARRSGYALLPVLALCWLFALIDGAAFRSVLAPLSWLLGGAALWSCLHSVGRRSTANTLLSVWHTASLLAVVTFATTLLLAQDAWFANVDPTWMVCIAGLLPALTMVLVPYGRAHWPLQAFPDAYLIAGLGLLAGWLMFWVLAFGWFAAIPAPLPYLPLANPLELMQIAALLLAYRWMRTQATFTASVLLGLCGFALVNQITLRCVHVFADVPYTGADLAGSALVQSALSLLWTSLALAAMFIAARRAQRGLWLIGAALLALVVLKLLLIDLSDIGTVPRIVSFMGVGGLMLLIGYLAPLPPAARPADAADRSADQLSGAR